VLADWRVGAVTLTSPGKTLPAFSLGLETSINVVRTHAWALRALALASAPVAYSGNNVCTGTGTAPPVCGDGGLHASQLGLVQGELVLGNGQAPGYYYGLLSAGAYRANWARKPSPSGPSPDPISGSVFGIGAGRAFGGARPKVQLETRVYRFSQVFGQGQWALAVTIGIQP
jgi:hypothetical protein